MNNAIGIAFVVIAAAQFLVAIAYLVNVARLLRRLAAHHKPVHESIGSPLLFANNTPRNNVLFFRWIWRRDFAVLDDPVSVALARRVRWLLVWLIAGFVIFIVLFIAVNFSVKPAAPDTLLERTGD